MEVRRGTVTDLSETDATVAMDDGTVLVVSVPEMIQVELGMAVAVVDTGDGRPVYKWGD